MFGFYSETSQAFDQIAHQAPEYLIVTVAGNDRGLGPDPGLSHEVWIDGAWQESSAARLINGGVDGYDCISHGGVAKNVITVGAIDEWRTLLPFSGWGPTDDGRVKPDVVAFGRMVLSIRPGFSGGVPLSGTSMAAPMVSGSAGLLLQHQENLHPGQSLLSSTLKALILHSADDRIGGSVVEPHRPDAGQ